MKIICLDFDGVIHSYTSGWRGVDVIRDAPYPGAFEFIEALVGDPRFGVFVYSSRSATRGGIEAMRQWFVEQGMSDAVLSQLTFSVKKPPAWLTIDDRCLRFEGVWPGLDAIDEFAPHKLGTKEG